MRTVRSKNFRQFAHVVLLPLPGFRPPLLQVLFPSPHVLLSCVTMISISPTLRTIASNPSRTLYLADP
jgi:hypothetical protein